MFEGGHVNGNKATVGLSWSNSTKHGQMSWRSRDVYHDVDIITQTYLKHTDVYKGPEIDNPYLNGAQLPLDLGEAWFNKNNRMKLTEFISTLRPNNIIEVGSWKGRSAIEMAKLIQSWGKIYAVDTWAR